MWSRISIPTPTPSRPRFLVLDHQTEPYVDGAPQDEASAYSNADLVLNAYNDDRQARLYLKDGQMELFLKDPANQVMDAAGNGGPPFVGGPSGGRLYTMERLASPGDGRMPDSWKACNAESGGVNVNEALRETIIATPGEPNSP